MSSSKSTAAQSEQNPFVTLWASPNGFNYERVDYPWAQDLVVPLAISFLNTCLRVKLSVSPSAYANTHHTRGMSAAVDAATREGACVSTFFINRLRGTRALHQKELRIASMHFRCFGERGEGVLGAVGLPVDLKVRAVKLEIAHDAT